MTKNAEQRRLSEYRDRKSNWKHWGPYLSERGWGTVREDYSPTGEAWDYFPHDHARSRVYRWNEDGLAGISDRNQYLCFGLALWNGQDEILKERMFGLTGVQGNHGEDVKEYWFYLDSTPTHSYMKLLYKYPQAPFPYEQLVDENARRGYQDPEFELLDTGIFEDSRYFDVFVEYAKGDQDDILIRITAHNRGDEPAPLHLLPTLWFRNTWSWGYSHGPLGDVPNKPRIYLNEEGIIQTEHDQLDPYQLFCDGDELTIFTENETNMERLFGSPNRTPFVKDAFHRHIINHESGVVNPTNTGTKCAVVYEGEIAPGESNTIRLRLTNLDFDDPFADFDALFEQRVAETDEFYAEIQKVTLSEDERNVQRQAFAGMMWTKQLYYYDIHQWLKGDPVNTPPPGRKNGRNRDWEHLVNFDIISMPDKWEYPWYATWDLAFHTIPIVLVDPDFAKRQLTLMTREWYMHPNGQLPAYEWAFG
ncbi:MAG: glucosidase, partial [Chloroflexota bacterium]